MQFFRLPILLILVLQILQVTSMGQATVLQGIMSLNSLCHLPRRVFYVKDAITLVGDSLAPFKTANLSSGELLAASGIICRTTVDSSEDGVAGFLVNVENNLLTQRDHCTFRGKLFRMRSQKHSLSLGCAHHMTHFFPRPLRLSFQPTPLRQLVAAYYDRRRELVRDALTVTITTVAYDCARNRKLTSKKWSPCQQVDICIPSNLVCDGVNNCGQGEDERNCVVNKTSTTKMTRMTAGTTTPIVNLIPTFADVKTAGGSNFDNMVTASPISSSSVAMVMSFFLLNGFCIGFFLFLGLCSLGYCCSSRLYRAENEKSRRTFIGYFRKFGSFGAAKTESESAPTRRRGEAAEAARLKKASTTLSISGREEDGGIVRPQSTLPPSGYTFKVPTIFGLNLRNERRMKECEPEAEVEDDDGTNMRFLSSMLRQHHTRTNNMLASALLPSPSNRHPAIPATFK